MKKQITLISQTIQQKFFERFAPTILMVFLLCLGAIDPGKAKVANEVWALVNDSPITSLDVLIFEQRLPKMKGIIPSNIKTRSHILDHLINQVIVEQIAKEQTLSVPEDKLEERIQAMIKANNLKTKKELDAKLKERGSSLDIYIAEIRKQLLLFQIMQLYVHAKPPREKDVKAWYNKNAKKLGLEVHIKEIVIPYTRGNIQSELKANKEIARIRRMILGRKISFANAARKYSRRFTAKNGGNLGWRNVVEIDQMKANMAYGMRKQKRGSISQIFKTHKGTYYAIIQVMGVREVPYERVKQKIFGLLYHQKQEKALKKWFKQKRQRAAVTIYMPDYKRK